MLSKVYRQNQRLFDKYVDGHVIIDQFERQLNYWRNVARLFAKTDYILAIDADFALMTDFKKSIQQDPNIMDALRKGKAAFVLPALEFVGQVENTTIDAFPTTKEQVVQYLNEGYLEAFHGRWNRGHSPTNLKKWTKTNDIYKVMSFLLNAICYMNALLMILCRLAHTITTTSHMPFTIALQHHGVKKDSPDMAQTKLHVGLKCT